MGSSSLVYEISSNTAKFDAAMDRVRDVSENRTGRMLASFQRASSGINSSMASSEVAIGKVNSAVTNGTQSANTYGNALGSLQSPLNALITGIAALEATKEIVGRLAHEIANAQERTESLLRIAAGSQATGVGTTFFQSLTAQAKDLGIETTALVSILQKAREAATVRIGEGDGASNASAFQNRLTQHVSAGNLSAGDRASYDAAGSQEERIRAVLDLMDKLQAANRDLAAQDLGKTFFGPDFERLTKSGVDLVDALRKSLDGLPTAGGVRIATPEEVQRATELKNETQQIANIYAQVLKQPMEDIAYVQDLMAKSSLDWQLRVAEVAKNFIGIYGTVRDIGLKIIGFAQSMGILSADKSDSDGPPGAMRVKVNPKPRPADRTNPLPSLSSGSSSIDLTAVQTYILSLERARELAKAELDSVGKTNVEREKAIALVRAEAAARSDVERGKRDSPKLTDDEIRKINAAAEASAKFKDQAMTLEQQLRLNADMVRSFGQLGVDALSSMILEGKSFGDVMSNVASQLARLAIQAALLGTGPLAGLFGTAAPASAGANAIGGLAGLISTGVKSIGANAEGTNDWRGGPTWVGEKGPEIVNLPRGAQVIPNPVARAAGGGVTVQLGDTHIDARGSTMSPSQFRAILDERDRSLLGAIPAAVRNAKGRGKL